MKNRETGNRGEAAAIRFLERKGHKIMTKNYRFYGAEVDIFSKDGNTLVAVEVKTRRTTSKGSPALAITQRKQQQLIKAANGYIQFSQWKNEVRFDLIFVQINGMEYSIQHIENAFYA